MTNKNHNGDGDGTELYQILQASLHSPKWPNWQQQWIIIEEMQMMFVWRLNLNRIF